MTIDLFSLVLGIVCGVSVLGLYMEWRRTKRSMAELRESMKKIQADQAKALPHGTLANIEDIHAVINDLHFQNPEIDRAIEAILLLDLRQKYNDVGYQRVKELLSDIRENPRKYKDRPNRKRVIA
jgi:hypothetical protein